jgi:hypothetical protein
MSDAADVYFENAANVCNFCHLLSAAASISEVLLMHLLPCRLRFSYELPQTSSPPLLLS